MEEFYNPRPFCESVDEKKVTFTLIDITYDKPLLKPDPSRRQWRNVTIENNSPVEQSQSMLMEKMVMTTVTLVTEKSSLNRTATDIGASVGAELVTKFFGKLNFKGDFARKTSMDDFAKTGNTTIESVSTKQQVNQPVRIPANSKMTVKYEITPLHAQTPFTAVYRLNNSTGTLDEASARCALNKLKYQEGDKNLKVSSEGHLTVSEKGNIDFQTGDIGSTVFDYEPKAISYKT